MSDEIAVQQIPALNVRGAEHYYEFDHCESRELNPIPQEERHV